MYKKRQGTAGICGQLYETKLISLIHYRTKYDDDIEDYILASNVSDIGTFDDICIRATVNVQGKNKPVALFIQAKHRESKTVQLTLNRKRDLAKWFSSYLTISRLFKPDNKDVLFTGNFQELECLFIMYTTAKSDLNTKEFKSNFADKLNSWIGTGDEGLQPCHKEEDIVFLCDIIIKEQLATLAKQLAMFLSDNAKNDNGAIMPMYDELMLLYHVILGQKVLDVSEIKCKNKKDEHRVASFQTDFFTNDDEFIIRFKETLYIEMLRKRKLKEAELSTLLSKLFTKPLDITVLSNLIGNVVILNDKKFKLEFVSDSMSEDLKRQLEKVQVLMPQVNEAIELGAKGLLKNRNFKVPTAFGNKDLTIQGKEVEPAVFIASVIGDLKNKLVDLIKLSPMEKIIVIDESIGKEFLNLNAGLAGTIGNILVCDEDPKYMKFTDNAISGDLAKSLYSEVQSVIPNLHDYKFHIKVKTFPKLTFECNHDEDYEMLKDQVTVLAGVMGQFLCKQDDSILPMDDVILRYHVLVALKAIEVSEIQCLNEDDEHRLASFRHEFFESNDEFVVLFKRALFNEILKIRKINKNEEDLAVKQFLTSRQFKVPAAFGNKDITIKIKKSKIERRLDYLKLVISELLTKSGTDRIVTLDDSLEDGLQKLNGGIAGMVGNLFVFDENTKLIKFSDDWASLGELSKRLFMKLQDGTEDLHEYRFIVKVKKFPKLTFKRNEDDENLVKDFLKKLLFFTDQADEESVEKLLKDEIEDHQCLKVDNVRVTVDAVFEQYHKLIQTWWMLKEASYLTKQSKHYEDALSLIVDKPLMSIVSYNYMIKIKKHLDCTFNEKALNCLKLVDQPSATIFVTDNSGLTVAKMVQSLEKNDYFVFSLEYILDLPAKDYKTVTIELAKTNELVLIIIVCNNINRNWMKKLKDIAKLLEKKHTIFVTNQTLVRTIQTYFVQANNVVIDENSSLIQMSETSQKSILENANVIFQDVALSLNLIIDDYSMGFVEGEVLNTILNNKPIYLGVTNSNTNYENNKHLYINRRVGRDFYWEERLNIIDLLTLNDIPDDVAVVTATPGMGKSTLLTHLSLKTKELKPTVWIVRIDLLIYAEYFSKWQENKTNIDCLETVKFLCEVMTEKQSRSNSVSIELAESNGLVTLKSCTGDQWTVFELKMFLDYYNRKEIIFLFDGFDEICPTYTDEVLALITAVRNYQKKHKVWVTSRSYDYVVSKLEEAFGKSYELHFFSNIEQNMYLVNFWKSNIVLRDLTKKQYDNLCSFMEFMTAYYFDGFAAYVERGTPKELFLYVSFNFLEHLTYKMYDCPNFVITTWNKLYGDIDYKLDTNHFAYFSTPLHLYLFADYFQNRIKDESIKPNTWSLNINAYTVYESFVETMLKKRFKEKNKIDYFNPDNRNLYENFRVEFLSKHQKLGAYALFSELDYASVIFSTEDLIEIKQTIIKIKKGTEKSGFIHSVTNYGVPKFIHLTFTEYFAVQHICELLKTETRKDKQKRVWDFILNELFKRYGSIRDILCYKIKSDLRAIVRDNEQIIFDLLLEQGKAVFTYYAEEFRKYLCLNIKTSLLQAMDDEFDDFISRIYNLIGGITGIFGNLLFSENNTKHTNTDNWESLRELTNRLFIKLQRGIRNSNESGVKVKKFPFQFKKDPKNYPKYFLKRLIVFTNQVEDTVVETFLKYEIDDYQCVKVKFDTKNIAYTIIYQYFNLIQRWLAMPTVPWRQNRVKLNVKIDDHRTQKLYVIKLKDQPSAIIFITNRIWVTVRIILDSLKSSNKIYALSLDYILNLPADKYQQELESLKELNKSIYIIFCDDYIERTGFKKLEQLATVLENKRTIFVTKEESVKIILAYFLPARQECSLIQKSEKSHNFILESAKAMLEDLETCLDSVIDEEEEENEEVLNTNPTL